MEIPTLKTVREVRHCPHQPGHLNLIITVQYQTLQPEDWPFHFDPSDPFGLSPEIAGWLATQVWTALPPLPEPEPDHIWELIDGEWRQIPNVQPEDS